MHWVGIPLEVASRRNDSFNWLFLSVRLHRDPVTFVWLFIYNLCVISLHDMGSWLWTGGILDHPDSSFWNPQWSASPVPDIIRPSFSTVHPASPLLCAEKMPSRRNSAFIESTSWAFCNVLLPISTFKNHLKRLWFLSPKEAYFI